MREIEFRAWAKYGEMLHNVQNHITGEWAFGNMLKSDDFIVMQYTEKKDDNDVKIFDGDIAHIEWKCGHKANYQVDIENIACGAWCINKDECNPLWECLDKSRTVSYKIIGNIHENPELLK